MKYLVSLIVLLAISVGSSSASGIQFEHSSFDEALAKAKKENKALFVDVYATWCGPCKYLTANTFTDDAVGAFFDDNFIALKMNGEVGEGPDFMMKYSLNAYPSLLFFSSDGELLLSEAGAMDAAGFLAMSKGALDPSQSPLVLMSKQYEEGDRDRQFLLDYASVSQESDKEFEWILDEYRKVYSPLDLKNETDFAVFTYQTESLDDPQVTEYLEMAEALEAEYPDAVADIVNSLAAHYVMKSVGERNPEHIKEMVKVVYPKVEFYFVMDYPTEADFLQALMDVYDSYLEEEN